MVNLVYCLTNLFYFFDIPLLWYYISFRSSIIFCLSSGKIYFSLGISLLCLFLIVFELFCGEFVETFIILSATLLPIKLRDYYAIFWITIFKVVLSPSVTFLAIFTAYVFTYIFINVIAHIFSKRQNSIVLFKYLIFRLN